MTPSVDRTEGKSRTVVWDDVGGDDRDGCDNDGRQSGDDDGNDGDDDDHNDAPIDDPGRRLKTCILAPWTPEPNNLSLVLTEDEMACIVNRLHSLAPFFPSCQGPV